MLLFPFHTFSVKALLFHLEFPLLFNSLAFQPLPLDLKFPLPPDAISFQALLIFLQGTVAASSLLLIPIGPGTAL
ncbi:MAG: hypothetical protein VX608_17205 [Chloroflexota bacterium]|nr:hypothetical protein [Chloroflexota bacterium]